MRNNSSNSSIRNEFSPVQIVDELSSYAELLMEDFDDIPYTQVPLTVVHPKFAAMCTGENNHHCRKLQRLLMCASNQSETSDDPHLRNLCSEGIAFYKWPYYYSDYHIKGLFEGESSDVEILHIQRRFAKVHDSLMNRGRYNPRFNRRF